MEERKHLFMYVEHTFMILGISLLVITVICAVVGEEAQEYSTMFSLGSAGIPVNTILQYLLSSVCITALRVVFFTDALIKRWSVAGRTIGMLGAVVVLIGVLAYVFGWFPVNDPKCWMAFLISFGVCFLLSAVLSVKKERVENRQLERALRQMKESKGGE
ncbi:MAG: hypothetical protein K2H12_10295 [Acetatifactor sp.]|nr:hypothetical protein [Acetatifactor sp.]